MFIGSNDFFDYWIINDTSADVIKKIKKGSLESQRSIDLKNYDSKAIERRILSICEPRDCSFLFTKLAETSDFKLIVQSQDGAQQPYNVHMTVLLMINSEFFKTFLFANDSKALQNKQLKLFEPEVCNDIMPLLIEFFYHGEFRNKKSIKDWSFEELEMMASAADYLQLNGLFQWCEKMIHQQQALITIKSQREKKLINTNR